MNRYFKMQVLIGMFSFGALYGAAEGHTPSVQRILDYMDLGVDALEGNSMLSNGIKHFFGVHTGTPNYALASKCFYKASGDCDIAISTRACLYTAAMAFLGGNGVERNNHNACMMAERVIRAKGARPEDRICAFLILDEALHTTSIQQEDIKKLRDIVAEVKELSDHFKDELYYRIARNFFYDGGLGYNRNLEASAMCVNGVIDAGMGRSVSLESDICALRDEIGAIAGKNSLPIKILSKVRRSPSLLEDRSESVVSVSSVDSLVIPMPQRIWSGTPFESNDSTSSQLSPDVTEESFGLHPSPKMQDLAVLKVEMHTRAASSNEGVAMPVKMGMRMRASKLQIGKGARSVSPHEIAEVRLDRPMTPETWQQIYGNKLKSKRSKKK